MGVPIRFSIELGNRHLALSEPSCGVPYRAEFHNSAWSAPDSCDHLYWTPHRYPADGSTDTNSKVLVKGVGENLLPTAQAWGLGGWALW